MDPQTPQQPPPYDPRYGLPQQPLGPLGRLSWKQKIILGAVLFALVLFFGVWNSCNIKAPQGNPAQQPQAGFLAPNPKTIESQREQAMRALQQAQAAEDLAKRRAEAGPTIVEPTRAGTQENPDAQFYRQLRQEKAKREWEAPYASGVGFVTRPPGARSERAESLLNVSAESAARKVPAASTVSQQPAAPGTSQTRNPSDPPIPPENYSFDRTDGVGPLHRLEEGMIIPATLLNQLDGEFAGPVICQISENVYDASGLNLLIPAGSKALGEARAVSSNNQRRLAVAFHRILMPDGYSLSLDKMPGLDQQGATALSGKVNHHFVETFGIAAAVGALAGLAQIGNTGAIYSPWYGFREGVSEQTALSGEQILNRYLNRYPTITIKPGSRVKIILITDLPDVPEYAHHAMPIDR